MKRSLQQIIGASALIMALAIFAAPLTQAIKVVKQEPVVRSVTYEAKPALPDDAQLKNDAENRAEAATDGATESYVGDANAKMAGALEKTTMSMNEVIEDTMKIEKIEYRLNNNKVRGEDSVKKTGEYARQTRDLVEQVQPYVEGATKRAVAEVVQEGIAHMNKEASAVKAEYDVERNAALEKAEKGAEEGSKPFVEAKKTGEKNIMDYLKEAQDLGPKVTEMKMEAVKIATEASALQGTRTPDGTMSNQDKAQKLMQKAHGIMGNALHFQGQAEGLSKTANSINGEIGLYDLAKGAAEAYASYHANPAGDFGDIPSLPNGLSFA